MTSTVTRTIARFAAGAVIAAGLAVGGSLGMTPVAVAETTTTSSNSDSQSQDQKKTTTRERKAPTGLNGNLPQRPASGGHEQFKHLPFNPAMPGGD